MGVLALWVLTVCVVTRGSMTDPGIISRHNVGTVFKRHHVPIVFNIAHIDMTLAIPYKLRAPVSRTGNRTSLLLDLLTKYPRVGLVRGSLISFMERMEHTIADLHVRAEDLFADLQSLLATPLVEVRARAKRAPVQFLEDVGWSFLGLATGSQINRLVQHIRTLDLAINQRDASREDRDILVHRLASKQLEI